MDVFDLRVLKYISLDQRMLDGRDACILSLSLTRARACKLKFPQLVRRTKGRPPATSVIVLMTA